MAKGNELLKTQRKQMMEKVVILKIEGKSYKTIGSMLDISPDTARRLYIEFMELPVEQIQAPCNWWCKLKNWFLDSFE